MLLVVTAIALLISVPLAGGRLTRLADIRVRAAWSVLLAAAIQVGITQLPGEATGCTPHSTSSPTCSTRSSCSRTAGSRAFRSSHSAPRSTCSAITSNGGVMPANPGALRIAGIEPRAGFDNSAALAHAHLAFLGDIIPVPGPWPIGNVLSVGDLIIFVGALIVLHRACGSRLFPRHRARIAESARISRDARGSTAGI